MRCQGRWGLWAALLGMLPCAASCGAEPPCGEARLGPLPEQPAWAVVTSDFVSSAIALLDRRGTLLTDGWIDSGTTAPGLATTLSGDVVLPTASTFPGMVTLVDRLGTDVITRIALPGGDVIGQTPTTLPSGDGEAAYRANPQDVIRLNAERVLVSRHEPNLDPQAPELDRGNDLVVIDLEGGSIAERIDLGSLDVEVERDGRSVRAFARPARMVRLGDRLVVGLARLSLDFRVAGPGVVAVVDLDTRRVQPVALGDLANCGHVTPVPDAPRRVAVACAGSPFGDEEARRSGGAGLALLDVPTEGDARIIHEWTASEHPDQPAASGHPVALGPTTVVAVAMGDAPNGTKDRLVRVDLPTGEARVVFEADSAFVLGTGSRAPGGEWLLVPDASRGVHRFEIDAHLGLDLRDTIDVSPCRRLGAREVRPL